MTIAMWFVWMLRGDIRGVARIGDPEGQRDFVCWWLSFGQAEYAAVWSCGPAQLEVAQSFQPRSGLPRLLAYLVRCGFIDGSTIDMLDLLCWYRVVGPSELSMAPPLPPYLIKLTEQPFISAPWSDQGSQVPRIAVELWSRSPHLQALWPADDPAARAALRAWYLQTGRHLLPKPGQLLPDKPCLPKPSIVQQRSGSGVNLVGYPRGELGIGEDVRMLSAALETASVPHAIIDVPFGPAARRDDDTVVKRITTQLDHPITIFCLTAFDTADLYVRDGLRFFSTTYRIGNWPWELPRFPTSWLNSYDLVDEIWAASRYTLKSYAAADPLKPLRLMPPAVAIGLVRRTPWRRMLPNPAAFTFIVPFDPYSSFRRKNPMAAVQAFRQAFPSQDTSVALILRINGNPSGQAGWPELQAAASGDSRIRCWIGTLDRAEALGVLRDADCLVSPHRAEGFGRNIAEAKLMGTPVLATGFSGSVDFLEPKECIDWQPVPLAPNEYPHGEGLWWAEPDIEHLARRMREIRSTTAPRKSAAVIKITSARNLRQKGEVYAHRVAEITAMLRAGSLGRN